MSSDKDGVKISWNVIMWAIGIVFLAGATFSTLAARAYVDAKVDTVASELNTIKIQNAQLVMGVNMLLKKNGLEEVTIPNANNNGGK